MKIRVVALMVLAASLPFNISKGDEVSPEARLGEYGFPVARGLKHVCGGHVTGAPPKVTEIIWDAFATNGQVEDVIAYYRSNLGDADMHGDVHGATWRFPLGATQPERVLEVSASTKEGPWRHCDSPALAKARCVVMVSRATRR
jgi:hypothetical protein